MGGYNPFSLEGKTILVTGASSGIGRATATACSKMGATVVATGRNPQKLEATLITLEGDSNQIIAADLTIDEDVKNLVYQIPKLDGIVHCAGIGHRMPAKLLTMTEVEKVMNSNFISAVSLQTQLINAKKVNKASSVVFVASAAPHMPALGNAAYTASKAAIIGYAKCLALELAPRNIRVNCICPAMVWTDLIMQEGVGKEELEQAQLKYPLKRYGQPDDVANLAIYLLSDASQWMTNSCIDITGGTNEL
ncbi:MAG: SDR family oxidoreductase [Bacteroidales bacterium]|nr:SDR family oxidoreductase [Bacteroidales bacterium]